VAAPALERQGRRPYRERGMAVKPFPVLFITASRIGDAVLSSGLIKTLVDEVPTARFTIVASALTAPLFAHTPGLEAVIVMDKTPGAGHWFGLWRKVRKRRWSLIVDLRGSAISGFLRRRRRAVHTASGERAHKVIQAARLLNLGDRPPAPFLFTTPGIEAAAARLTTGRAPILAMAPAAHWIGKSWPAERYGLVARQLLGPGGALEGGRLMVLGGSADQGAAEPVKAAVPRSRCIDMVGRHDLLTCFAALRHVRLFIGADSGLMHLAAAADAPTLGLFGPSDEHLYAPWGSAARSVRGARTFEEFRLVDPALDQQICHMMELSASSVLAAAERLLDDTEPEPPHA